MFNAYLLVIRETRLGGRESNRCSRHNAADFSSKQLTYVMRWGILVVVLLLLLHLMTSIVSTYT